MFDPQFVVLNLSREQLIEGLHEWHKCQRKVDDGREFLDMDTIYTAIVQFYRSNLYGLPDPDAARLLVWMLSTDDFKLPDKCVKGCGINAVNAWLRCSLNPKKATRGDVLKCVLHESPSLYVDDADSLGWTVKAANYAHHANQPTVPTTYATGQSALRNAVPSGPLRSTFGEDDVHAYKTLAEARIEAHRARITLGISEPSSDVLPAPDAGHIHSDLPRSECEAGPLNQADDDKQDKRGGDGLNSWLESRGFRKKNAGTHRYNPAAHAQRIIDDRVAEAEALARNATIGNFTLDSNPDPNLAENDDLNNWYLNNLYREQQQAEEEEEAAGSEVAPAENFVEEETEEFVTPTRFRRPWEIPAQPLRQPGNEDGW